MAQAPSPSKRKPRAAPSAPPAPADLPLPHERDEVIGHAGRSPRAVMRQASRDLQAGQVDTDLRATPGLDASRRRKLVPPGR